MPVNLQTSSGLKSREVAPFPIGRIGSAMHAGRLRVGASVGSPALAQIRSGVERLDRLLPGVSFEVVVYSSTESAEEAVHNFEVDFAMHRANDIALVDDDLDWFWLPRKLEACCVNADLQRTVDREALTIRFLHGNPRLLRLRSLFVTPLTFVGGGVGSADLCTVGGVKAIRSCEVCLHDNLLPLSLLDHLSSDAIKIDVGKRRGSHRSSQAAINDLLLLYVRQGRRVVRLKGGDPGVFGRLGEETEALETLRLPFRVIPGISSLSAATAETGMLLTRRGVSRGFTVMSARKQGGETADLSGVGRSKISYAFFMGMSIVKEIVAQLVADGMPTDTPAAIICDAAGDDQRVLAGTLSDLPARFTTLKESRSARCGWSNAPGLLLVGENARYSFLGKTGAFEGQRILLTCNRSLLDRAVGAVRDFGGHPLRYPLIHPELAVDAMEYVCHVQDYDWITVTSPSVAGFLFEILRTQAIDLRSLPRIAVAGPAEKEELRRWGVNADLCPTRRFGSEGLLDALRSAIGPGDRILRLRSDRACPNLTIGLRSIGATVDDVILYSNQPVDYEHLPEFDAAFFATAPAAETFVQIWGGEVLKGKRVVTIGSDTALALDQYELNQFALPEEATVEAGMFALAGQLVAQAMAQMK